MFDMWKNTPEEIARYEEKALCEAVNFLHKKIFCEHCNQKYSIEQRRRDQLGRRDCNNKSCPVGVHNFEGDTVRRMPLERKLALANTLPNTYIEVRKDGKFEVQMRNRKHQIYGVMNETGLGCIVEGVLQVGIWGTEPVWLRDQNDSPIRITSFEKKPIDSFRIVESALSFGEVLFQAETVLDEKGLVP